MNKKIYIIQFRTDASKKHEQECYEEELTSEEPTPVFFDATKGELPTEIPDDVVAILFGGSGEFYLSQEEIEKNKWIQDVIAYIGNMLEKNIPMLGICYGSQILAVQQGADMTDDKSMRETGTYELSLLDNAKDDPLFSQFENSFLVQLGHKNTPINFPETCIPLSKTERVPCQSFRVQNKPVWGFTFHPELNQERLLHRLRLFPEYIPEGQTAEEIAKDFKDTPDAARLFHLFVEYAVKYRS
jgi:GMP synthase (glutamine-hydrolysing)